MRGKRDGFTLVELIVVLVVLSVITAIAVPSYLGYVDSAKEKECRTNMKALAAYLDDMRVTDSNATMQDVLDAHPDITCPSGGTYQIGTKPDGDIMVASVGDGGALYCSDHGQSEIIGKSGGTIVASTEGKVDPNPPAGPTNLTNPANPTNPTNPTEPEDKGDGNGTTDPTEPTEPGKPDESGGGGNSNPNPQESEKPDSTEKETNAPSNSGDGSGGTGQTETEAKNPGGGSDTEPELPEADFPGDANWNLADGLNVNVGSWYAFCAELKAWGDAHYDGHQRLFYVEKDGVRHYYIFTGTSGGVINPVACGINGTESPEEFAEKVRTGVFEVRMPAVRYEEIVDVNTVAPPGTLVLRDGKYYIATDNQNSYFRDAVDGAQHWQALTEPYVPQTVAKVGETIYPATDSDAVKALEPSQEKWFEAGDLLVKDGKTYASKKVQSVKGGADVPLNEFYEIPQNPKILDYEKDFADDNARNQSAEPGTILIYNGRYFLCVRGGQYSGVKQQRDQWILLR